MIGAAPEAKPGDGFLEDVDNLAYEIHCVQCKKPIWKTRILKRLGAQPVATETLPLGGHEQKFSRHIVKCPLCTKRFYTFGKKGFQMYLIKDLKSGLTRLI